jgi:hypothetical protein
LETGRVGVGVVKHYIGGIFAEGIVHIHHFSVACIGTVLLESHSQNQYPGVFHQQAFFVHQFEHPVAYVAAHAVVKLTGIAHHAGQVTVNMRLFNQIVGVDAYAMTTYQSGAEAYEIPFGGSGVQYFFGIEIHSVEYPS